MGTRKIYAGLYAAIDNLRRQIRPIAANSRM